MELNDLGIVHEEIIEASTKWYDLGLKLGVGVNLLDSIRSQFSNPKECLRETLKQWLKTSDDTTWKILVEALRSPVITEARLAARLERKHCVDPQEHGQIQQQMKELLTEVHQMKRQLETRDREIESLRQELQAQPFYIPTMPCLPKKRRQNKTRQPYQGKKRHKVFSTFMPTYQWPNHLQ